MLKVLVIDDSALIRQLLTEIVNAQPDMRVVGTAGDPIVARERIKKLLPDVLTLDIEMPRMDGLAFLERLMQLRPMPVVMISSLTRKNADATLRALELGAVDFVEKPTLGISDGLQAYAETIADKIRIAAKARLRPRAPASKPRLDADAVLARKPNMHANSGQVIVIGASTGGTEALREILVSLPAEMPPIVVAQHMPAAFTPLFAARLNSLCAVRVKEAEDGEVAQVGHVYIAPGGAHVLLHARAQGYWLEINGAPPVNRHRPSVDVLFRSAANCAGPQALGVLLTGMGSDGAAGLLEMKQAGAHTLAQDEASCVVFGMPKSAIELGAAAEVISLQNIAARMAEWITASATASRRTEPAA